MATTDQVPSLQGWDICHRAESEWTAWGANGDARAKVLGAADGYTVALIEAPAGYKTAPHEHNHAEFFYLLDGAIRNQGQTLVSGDGYAAAAGSVHSDFEVQIPSSYLSIFRL